MIKRVIIVAFGAIVAACSQPNTYIGYQCINKDTHQVLDHVNGDQWNLEDTQEGFYGTDSKTHLEYTVRYDVVPQWGCREVEYPNSSESN